MGVVTVGAALTFVQLGLVSYAKVCSTTRYILVLMISVAKCKDNFHGCNCDLAKCTMKHLILGKNWAMSFPAWLWASGQTQHTLTSASLSLP